MSEVSVVASRPAGAVSRPAPQAALEPGARFAVVVCFFLSGAAGLIYEVVWAKHLALFIGSTGLSHTIILASFMGGLALGSWVLGRVSDNLAHPLRAYAIIELGIGCYGVFYPSISSVMEWGYFQVAEGTGIAGVPGLALKLLLSAILLVPPTFLMGGTLPLLGRFLAQSGDAARAVSVLYFLNSFGAVAGTLVGGFLLIPEIGLRTSTVLTGGLNLVVATIALVTALRSESEEEHAEAGPLSAEANARRRRAQVVPLGGRDRLLLWGIGASGFVGMVYELGWVRYFTQVLGSSSHSFTLMLGAFISGITLGGLAAARWVARTRDLRFLFAACQLGIGAAVLAPLLAYERFPYWFWWASGILQRSEDTYRIHLLAKYLFVFLVMLVPTFFSGLTLPVVTAQLARRGRLGAQIGLVYAGNTLGTVAGALAAGFLLLPLAGIQWTLKIGVLLNLGIAVLVLGRPDVPPARIGAPRPAGLGRRLLLWSSAALAALAVLVPGWDPRLLSFGVYRRTDAAPPSFAAYRAAMEGYRVTFAEEGTDARVLVVEAPEGTTSLVVNGKSDASNGSDMSTQMLIGHLPMFFHRDPRDVLVVGLGSGVTAASVLSHRPEAPVDCVEILPPVARAARRFAPWNNGVLEDPGLQLVIDDAKSFLRAAGRRYDVIVSEPTNPWIAGVGNLFSTEFYRDCLAHLRPDGLMVQFFHAYEMSDELVQVMARTFLRSFPFVYTFNTGSAQADFILLGSRSALAPDFDRMAERLQETEVRKDLARIGISSLAGLLILQSHSPATLSRFAGEGRLNTDDLPIFENEGPRAFFASRRSEALGRLDERRGRGERLFIRERLKRSPLEARELRSLVEMFRMGVVENSALLFSAFREYLGRAPGDLEAWCLFAEELLRAGKPQTALALLLEARGEAREPAAELRVLRLELRALRQVEKEEVTPLSTATAFKGSKQRLERCLELDRRGHDLYFLELAKLAAFEGDRALAARWLERAQRYRRENPALASLEVREDEIQALKRWASGAG